jgi:hypothetical protein
MVVRLREFHTVEKLLTKADNKGLFIAFVVNVYKRDSGFIDFFPSWYQSQLAK